MAFPPTPDALSGLLGLDSESWQDRVKPGAYESPSGTEIKYDFEDVSVNVTKRGTAFEYAGVNGAYVQQAGYGARRYPLLCYFTGANHDRIGTAFLAALLEDGTGKLTHPLYGKIPVVPLGDINRRDDLKSAANQTVIEVTFWTTLGAVYPSGQGDPKSEVDAALEGFDVAAAQQFKDSTDLVGTVSQANARASVRGFLRAVSSVLTEMSSATESVNKEFRSLQRDVNFGLDVLVGQPLQLALQITNLIKAPGRALAGIVSRLEGYARLADKIFGSSAGSNTLVSANLPSLRKRLANDLHIADLFAMSAVAGSVTAVVNNQFTTRRETLDAAEAVLAQLDAVVAWREAEFADLEQLDTGGSYQALQNACALAAGFLIEISFTLLPERRITLDRARTIVDLAAELYGSVDDRLDFLISSNNLTGAEILELQRGRVIVYYTRRP